MDVANAFLNIDKKEPGQPEMVDSMGQKQNKKQAAGSKGARVTKKAPNLPKYEDSTPEGMKKGISSGFLKAHLIALQRFTSIQLTRYIA